MSHPIEIPTPPAEANSSPAMFRAPWEPGRTHRTRLWESSIGLVEDLRSSSTLRNGSPEAYSPFFQICLPYRGLFVWHVGHDDVVADPNQVLFVAGGESFRLSQPVAGRYAELIITPDCDLLAELTQSSPLQLSRSSVVSPAKSPSRFEAAGVAGPVFTPGTRWSVGRHRRRGTAYRPSPRGLATRARLCDPQPSNAAAGSIDQRVPARTTVDSAPPARCRPCGRCVANLPDGPIPAGGRRSAPPLRHAVTAGARAGRIASRLRPHDPGLQPWVFESQSLHGGIQTRVRLHAISVP